MVDFSLPVEQTIHLWLVRPETFDAASVAVLYSRLNPDEQQRLNRFHFPRDRHTYLVAHGLLRSIIGAYLGVLPTAWQEHRHRWGKPGLAYPQTKPPLQYNLSHTHGLVALAVTCGANCGVDVENARRHNDTTDLARSFFAPDEWAQLNSLPHSLQQRCFFTLWTLKEAYAKARGLGLSLSFNRFAFSLDAQEKLTHFAPEPGETAHSWGFYSTWPTVDHALAVACRAPQPTVITRWNPPLLSITAVS